MEWGSFLPFVSETETFPSFISRNEHGKFQVLFPDVCCSQSSWRELVSYACLRENIEPIDQITCPKDEESLIRYLAFPPSSASFLSLKMHSSESFLIQTYKGGI
jgi:hypothetical protein